MLKIEPAKKQRLTKNLIASFKHNSKLNVSEVQNYQPIHKMFFDINRNNVDTINFDTKWSINEIFEDDDEDEEFKEEQKLDHRINKENINTDSDSNSEYTSVHDSALLNIFNCGLLNNKCNKKYKDVFFKLAPLIDPIKYLTGKYKNNMSDVIQLPKFNAHLGDDLEPTANKIRQKINNIHNSSYIDGFFAYLSGRLFNEYNMMNGVNYYGSYVAIKNNFKINIFDDLELLEESTFFKEKCKDFFHFDDFNDLFEPAKPKLKPLVIHDDIIDICDNSNNTIDFKELQKLNIDINDVEISPTNTLMNLVDLTETDLKSNSDSDSDYNSDDESGDASSCSSGVSHTETSSENNNDVNSQSSLHSDEPGSDYSDLSDEEVILTIPEFPINIICMDACDDTFDNLIMDGSMTPQEWYSALFQINMILLIYQKAFNFTHNDLHTNNVMYCETDVKHIFYKYNNKVYKVPTFGRIFKIIDFGRAIFSLNKERFCSDSYAKDGDATTQYNTEPFLNNKKKRIEPNHSFDLCRLGCSIFDYLIEDIEDVCKYVKSDDTNSMDYVIRLIIEWCSDDNGLNMLYKRNGNERYPDFKLYKMIARCVHKHTPCAQLERDIFKQYITTKNTKSDMFTDIDTIPRFV